jgi:hypothetical protein
MSNVNLISIVALAPSMFLVVYVLVGITASLARDTAQAFAPRVRTFARRGRDAVRAWTRELLTPAPDPIDLPAPRLSRV